MTCDLWQDRIDAFVDAELPESDLRSFEEHLRSCPACSAETLARQRLKAETRLAGTRFAPTPEFERRLRSRMAPQRSSFRWAWIPAFAAALAVLIAAAALGGYWRQNLLRHQMLAQLVDQHVAALASSNPVDVVSSDSHTVKPWFAGKVPFSVDLPQLDGTPFTLVGGRMAYFQQAPAAQLIFAVRKHRISVFMFREHGETPLLGNRDVPSHELSYAVESWTEDGLRYFAVSDSNPQDVRQLCLLLRQANEWQ